MAAITAALLAAKILSGLKIGAGLAKGAYAAHPFATSMLAYTGVAGGFGAYEGAGERGLSREQMRLQTLLGKSSAEATKLTVKESRARTKEYMKTMMKMKMEDRKEAREMASIQSFQQSQDRQMALVLQAMQAIGQQRASARGSGVGRLGLMRS